MLQAMTPALPCAQETFSIRDIGGVVGCLSYGTDTHNPQIHRSFAPPVSVFMLGELYNDEVRDFESPAEYLAHRYNRFGSQNFAAGLNGSFSAVIADSLDRSIILVTDHVCSRPLFTTINGGRLFFASEVKAFFGVPKLDLRPDPATVMAFASCGFFLGCKTLVGDVSRIDYATILQLRQGALRSWRYWDYVLDPGRNRDVPSLLSDLVDLLRVAVKRRTRTGRVAIMLSGGVDSRAILAALNGSTGMPAITLVARGQKNQRSDGALAARVAADFGVKHFVIENAPEVYWLRQLQESISAMDGAAGYMTGINWDAVRHETGIDYLLWGDECMGLTKGLTSFARVLPQLGIHPVGRFNALVRCIHPDRLQTLAERSEADLNSLLSSSRSDNPYDCVDQLYMTQRLQNVLLPKRAFYTRAGFRGRMPWLDLDILNFVRTLPVRHRIGKKLFRRALARMNPQLYKYPRAVVGENPDTRSVLIAAEKQNKSVSTLILQDNPLLDEFFDKRSVEELILRTCSASPARPDRQASGLKLRLPLTMRLMLAATARYFLNPKPTLPDSKLLLRILALSIVFRSFPRASHLS